MARAIDASELIVEIQVCSWDSEQDKERAEDIVLGMPTLTSPNEALTCEGAIGKTHGSFGQCFDCVREKTGQLPPPAGGGSRWRMKSYFSL